MGGGGWGSAEPAGWAFRHRSPHVQLLLRLKWQHSLLWSWRCSWFIFLWGLVLCLSGDDRFSQWPPLCWFVVLLWQSCMSYHPRPLWITRSNFPWVLMALLVLLMTSAMMWHLYPHPTRSLVLMVTKFLRSLIPIQVWCWALLFPSHDGAWSWVGFGLFGLMVRVCWLILHFHWGHWLLCCRCFLSSLWFPSCH